MDFLQNILEQSLQNKYLFGLSLRVHKHDEEWQGDVGNIKPNDSFFIASTTKLFTSALIFKLRQAGKLTLHDPISRYVSPEVMNGLHVFKGKEYSSQLTIKHLLSHTSGLPDYFKGSFFNGKTLEAHLTEGHDVSWDLQQAVDWSKQMTPHFEPSKPNKALYSDTNYQLLGNIVEQLYEASYADVVLRAICAPLALSQTYVYEYGKTDDPIDLNDKSGPLKIPKAMSSFGPDGGVVSTNRELMKFIRAFFGGSLFPITTIQEIQEWNRIFFPLEAGIGLHRFKIPWFFSPFQKIPPLIGHSGLSGAFAFYAPEMDTYLTGTVNQIYHPGNSYKLMIKVLSELKKKYEH